MDYLLLEKKEKIAVITLNRAPANALSSGLIKELGEAFNSIETDEDVKAVLIHGEGRFFSAGADIKEFTTIKDEEGFAELGKYGQDLFDRIENFSKPVIAAIHGAALGGGLELAMACHIRYVAEDAKLGLPELTLGLVPGFAGSQRLPFYVGTAKAAEMLITSEPISGTEAVAYKLANAAFPAEQVYEKAYNLAQKAAAKSAVSVSYALELLRYAREGKWSEGAVKERELFGKAFMSADGQEGIAAFIEKRKPDFKDR